MSLKTILQAIVNDNELHAKWLNTLSYLEHCGAKKIAERSHPTLVRKEMLKHAAEEFRHAHYLKQQISKVANELVTYAPKWMLGEFYTLHYLSRLDTAICRYLKRDARQPEEAVKEMAYFLVTYAIEIRANELYRIYDEVLKQASSRVAVKSILLEEKEHLNEMQAGIDLFENGKLHAEKAQAIEQILYERWITAIASDINHR